MENSLYTILIVIVIAYVISSYRHGPSQQLLTNKEEGKPIEIKTKGFKSAQAYIRETREMLVEYYGGAEWKLTEGFARWDGIRNKTTTVLANRFTYSLLHKKKLSFGFIGSSVMAGHDNCHYDSFPSQLGRMMEPIFEKIPEFDFEIRNAGIKGTCGDSFRNRIWCLEHLVGDVDTVMAVWQYFGWIKYPANIEAFIRFALMGGAIPMTIHRTEKTSFIWGYGGFGYNEIHMSRFADLMGGNTGWGQSGDGMHPTTRYGEKESPARRQSLGVNYRNWHPGPLTFQYMSDLVFYLFADAIDLALTNIKKMSPKQRGALKKPEYKLPPPSVGYGHWYSTKKRPYCITATQPAYGKSSIKVSGNWNHWVGDIERKIPPTEKNFGFCQHLDRCGGWNANGGKQTFSIPKIEKGILMLCGNINGNFKITIDKFTESFVKKGYFQRKCFTIENFPDVVYEKDFDIHVEAFGGMIDHVIAA